MYLEIYKVAPVSHPVIEQLGIMSFHQLIAAPKLGIDPARQVQQSLRRHPAVITKAAIYGHGVVILEVLDYHVQRLRASNFHCWSVLP